MRGGGILAGGRYLVAGSAGIGGTGRARRGLGRLSGRTGAVRDVLLPARVTGKHVDLVAGSAAAAWLRPAAAASVNARGSRFSVSCIRQALPKGKAYVRDTFRSG